MNVLPPTSTPTTTRAPDTTICRDHVKSATCDFTQQRLDQNSQGRPAQSGQFSFKRPGQFKWAVVKPYEQLIISDGKRVYQYDPDLAQVPERGVDQSIGASPAAIIFGSG